MGAPSIRDRRSCRLVVAAGASIALHLIVVAAAMPGPRPPDRPAMTEVELVPRVVEPAAPVSAPPVRPPEEPVLARRAVVERPLLASLSSPLTSQPFSVLPEEPLPEEPPTEVPAPLEPAPLIVPWVPSPRETARRQVLLDNLPPLTDRDRVEARVQGIMKGALAPLPDDRSPAPQLVPDGAGNLVHRDGALVATIRPDGTVEFGTGASASVDELDPGRQDDIVDMHTTIPGVPLAVSRANEADCAADRCYDKAGPGLTIRPSQDLNDLVLRAKGDDPLAARKRRFLRLTEELRDGLADEHRRKTLSRSRLQAGHHLEKVWSDGSLSFAAKRRLLFQLWDECEEPEGERDDRPEARAGLRTRRHVLGFIRAKLPPGDAEAYSPEELRRLNSRRKSVEPFSPYR